MSDKNIINEMIVFYRAVLVAVSSHGLALAISFVGSVLLTRELGADGRGVVSWIVSYISVGAILAQAGMGHTNRRFAVGRRKRVSALFILTILVCLSLSVAFAAIVAYLMFSNSMGFGYEMAIWLALLHIPIGSIGIAAGEILVSLSKSKAYSVLNIIEKTTNTLLVIFMVLLGMVTPFFAILAIVIAGIFRLLAVIYFLRHEIKARLKGVRYIAYHIGPYTLFNFVASSALLLASHIVTIILGNLSTAVETGWFAATMILINALRQLASTTGIFALPRLAKMPSHQAKGLFKKNIVIVTLVLTIAASGVCIVLSDWLMPFIFGADFDNTGAIFRCLLVGLIFCALLFVLQSFIAADSKTYVVVVAPIVLVIVTLVMGLFLIPGYGALGAAYSWSIAHVMAALVAVVIAYTTHQHLKVVT